MPTTHRSSWRRRRRQAVPTRSDLQARNVQGVEIGAGMRVCHSEHKGRVVVATEGFRRGSVVMQEKPIPLTLLVPTRCCVCAMDFIDWSRSRPGAQQCKPGVHQCARCLRYFCGSACSGSAQHLAHECRVLRRIDGLQHAAKETPSIECAPSGTAARSFASRYSEAVARLALLPLHDETTARQVAQLDSSFPVDGTPFGEHASVMAASFERLATVLPPTIAGVPTTSQRLWFLYGQIHTNTECAARARPVTPQCGTRVWRPQARVA
jgi:hypothetical protein